jgi:DNA-binding transcriptional regulator YdaS (Cro superfamily)
MELGPEEMEPRLVCAIDQEVVIRALSAAEEAKDFAHELLAIHDTNLGRALKRHRMMAEELEKSIEKAARVQVELRSALGWPQRT